MDPDKYQQAWRADATRVRVAVDEELLSQEVQRSERQLRSTVFWRDFGEVATSLSLIPVWLALGIYLSLPWTWYLTVLALIWVAGFIVFDRRRHPQRPSAPGKPLLYHVKESLTQVEHQIWLLRNVGWWYLLPFGLSLMAFFVHVTWDTLGVWWQALLGATFPGLFVFLLYSWIYRLNQRAVREQLEPRRQDLLKFIARLENDSTSETLTEGIDLVSAFNALSKNRSVEGRWDTCAENWNRLVPAWRAAAAILVPTVVAAVVAAWFARTFAVPQLGPVFFQTVVAAVIAFEIALLLAWLHSRRTLGQPRHADEHSDSSVAHREPENVEQRQRARWPGLPAIAIIFLTVLISILAILALVAFSLHASTGANV